MPTLYVFKVAYYCGGGCGCGGCREKTKKALEEAYGASIKFNIVEEDEIHAEGDAILPAKIIAELRKLRRIMKAEIVAPPKKDPTGTGGGGGGSNANGAKVPNNGGNMGLMVPPMGQNGQQPWPMDNNQHYGYPQQHSPVDNNFSNENANGCTIM